MQSAHCDTFYRFYFKTRKVRFPEDWESELKAFFKGKKRDISEAKGRGEIKVNEGKSPLSFSAYKFLAMVRCNVHAQLMQCNNCVSQIS